MGSIRRKLALLFIGRLQGHHGAAREHMAHRRGNNQGDNPQDSQGVSGLLHAVIHGGDILAHIDGLQGAVHQPHTGHMLGCHHHLGLAPILPVLREDRHLPLGSLPVLHLVQDKGLDAEGGPGEIQQASVTVKHIKEQTVIRALVEHIIIYGQLGVLVQIPLGIRYALRRIHQFPCLLRSNGPLHRHVHHKEQQDEEHNHDNRIQQGQPLPAAPEQIFRHRHQAPASNL